MTSSQNETPPPITCFPPQVAQSSGYNIEEPARTTDQLNLQNTEVRALFHLGWLGFVQRELQAGFGGKRGFHRHTNTSIR